ncbi:MAG: ROK family protein [Phycisphaerales bacterium]|jgi:glucokinase|nr:ROK family protein [Phycisphaerales bacterium]MBT7170577.1 ROK family protein [Phycisphaerales bacterium]
MTQVCIGIDFGGTGIKYTALDEANTHREIYSVPTPVADGKDAILKQIVTGCEDYIKRLGLSRDDVLRIGIGSPGPLSVDRGIILALPNIPNMKNVPIKSIIEEATGIPTTLENDANAASYAEFLCGAGAEVSNMVMLTLGTGVGSGIIIGGSLVHGAHDMGGELGHLIVDPGGRLCSCGQKGCLEEYSSAGAMGRYATKALRAGEGSDSLLQTVLAEKGSIDALDIENAMLAGDAFAKVRWDEFCHFLAIGCVNIIRMLDPDRIVLSGGITKAGDTLYTPLMEQFRAMDWTLLETQTDIAIAQLGSDAGAVGAAGVAWYDVKNQKGA